MTNTFFNQVISDLKKILKNFDYDVYAVGGCVRDLLMGKDPDDIDLIIDAPEGEEKILGFLEENFPTRIHGVTRFGKFHTGRFILNLSDGREADLDVVMPRIESYHVGDRHPDKVDYADLSQDALRRDFTLNALYYNVKTDKIVDPTGKGRGDLGRGILRTPLDPEETFKEDPLRMMRAIRFSVCKGFTISQEVLDGILSAKESIKTIARERTLKEMSKILESENPSMGFFMLYDSGLLENISPRMSKKFDPECVHKMRTLAYAGIQGVEVRCAAYFKYTEDPKVIEDILINDFRCPLDIAKNIARISTGIKFILETKHPSDAELRKFYRTQKAWIDDIIELAWVYNEDSADYVRYRIYDLPKATAELATGEEIMNTLGIAPGRKVKEVKEKFLEFQDENPDITKEEAFAKLL